MEFILDGTERHVLEREKVIQQLRQLRTRKQLVFDSEMHGLDLNPVLSKADVTKFEETHRTKLPPSYRHFLTHIGNGGAGPFYGIFPLGMIDDGHSLAYWNGSDGIVGDLSKPYRHQEAWNDLSGMPIEEDSSSEDEYWELMEEFEAEYWSGSVTDGAIPICHMGCALRVLLVLKGPQADHLWVDARADKEGISPLLLKDGQHATFASWYEEWLIG